MRAVILSEFFQFWRQIIGVPGEHVAKEFTAQVCGQSLDAGVRQGHVRNCFDRLNLQDAQIRVPAVIPEQRIIVRTQRVRSTLD